MQDCRIVLGQVVGVFGVKGWLKIKSFSSPVENIFLYNDWVLSKPGGLLQNYKLEAGQPQGKGLIAKLQGISDRDEASALVGSEVRISEQQLPELQDGEYYWYQLESLTVVNELGQCLGEVSHMMETGANDVMVVKPCAGSVDDRERLIPYLPGSSVLRVQLADRQILVSWDVGY